MHSDSWAKGIAYGLLWTAAGAILWAGYDHITKWLGPAADRLAPPVIQMVVLAAAILHFRFMIVKWKTQRAAKGMFLILFLAVLLMFFTHRYSII